MVLPFFSTTQPEIERGSRFQIKDVDWKVVACYPPCGVVNKETKVRVGCVLFAFSSAGQREIILSK